MPVLAELLLAILSVSVTPVLSNTCSCNQGPDNVTCTARINNPYPSLVLKVPVDGRCVYALEHPLMYEDARAFCENNSLRLVQLRETCQQKAVFEVTDWPQHWVGLEKSPDNKWQWTDKNGQTDANIPSSRWENAPGTDLTTHTRACTTYIQDQYRLNPVEETASYRPVCEDYTCIGIGGTGHPNLHVSLVTITTIRIMYSCLKKVKF